MKIKTIEIVQFSNIYPKIANQTLPAKTLFKLNRIIKKVEDELTSYNKALDAIRQNYGEKDEEGELKISSTGEMKFKQEFIDKVNEDLKSLHDTEIEIEDGLMISVDDISDLRLNLEDYRALSSFIKE